MARTRSLQQIQKQIAELQREAETIRHREKSGVIDRIREAIAHYALSAEELFGLDGAKATRKRAGKGLAKAAKKAKAPAKAKKPVAAKYRDADGNTWSGRGRQPRWLAAALKDGKKLEDFAIKA